MRLLAALMIAAFGAIAVGCGGGYKSTPTSPSTSPPSSGGSVVTVQGDGYGSGTFSPGSLTVALGTTVTWRNNDSVAHTTTSDAGLWSGSLAPGGSATYTFSARGTFKYHCAIHGNMTGEVAVQ